jgi:hypothetical protein
VYMPLCMATWRPRAAPRAAHTSSLSLFESVPRPRAGAPTAVRVARVVCVLRVACVFTVRYSLSLTLPTTELPYGMGKEVSNAFLILRGFTLYL